MDINKNFPNSAYLQNQTLNSFKNEVKCEDKLKLQEKSTVQKANEINIISSWTLMDWMTPWFCLVIPQARSDKESSATTYHFLNYDLDSSIPIRSLRNDTYGLDDTLILPCHSEGTKWQGIQCHNAPLPQSWPGFLHSHSLITEWHFIYSKITIEQKQCRFAGAHRHFLTKRQQAGRWA